MIAFKYWRKNFKIFIRRKKKVPCMIVMIHKI